MKIMVKDLGLLVFGMMKNLGPLVLGWFLGILSPFVTDKIRNRQKRKELLRTIRVELDELRHYFVCLTYKLALQVGPHDRDILRWTLENHKKYQGILPNEMSIYALQKLSELNDDQLNTLANDVKKSKPSEKMALGLKTLETPYIDAHLGELHLLSSEQQSRIFEIRRRLHLINQEIHQARCFFQKTFSSNLSEHNETVLNSNIISSYKAIGEQARNMVDHINELFCKISGHNT